jgi:hypothetical protein
MERITRNVANAPTSARRGREAEPIVVGNFRYETVREAAELLARRQKLTKASATNNLYRFKRASKEFAQAQAGVQALLEIEGDGTEKRSGQKAKPKTANG